MPTCSLLHLLFFFLNEHNGLFYLSNIHWITTYPCLPTLIWSMVSKDVRALIEESQGKLNYTALSRFAQGKIVFEWQFSHNIINDISFVPKGTASMTCRFTQLSCGKLGSYLQRIPNLPPAPTLPVCDRQSCQAKREKKHSNFEGNSFHPKLLKYGYFGKWRCFILPKCSNAIMSGNFSWHSIVSVSSTNLPPSLQHSMDLVCTENVGLVCDCACVQIRGDIVYNKCALWERGF